MTFNGPFQPKPFSDSVIRLTEKSPCCLFSEIVSLFLQQKYVECTQKAAWLLISNVMPCHFWLLAENGPSMSQWSRVNIISNK